MTGFSRRDLLRTSAGAAASLPVFVTTAGVETGDVPEGPTGVHLACGRDPASTMRVGWSGAPTTDARVEYGRVGEPRDATVRATPEAVPGEQLTTYRAALTGLAPGTAYEYEAVLDGRRAGPFTFETGPGTGEPFRVTAVGDHGIADPDNPFQRPDTDDPVRIVERALAQGADLHVGVGDISYANGHPTTWETYFADLEFFYAETPFMTVPGNHEVEPGTGMAQYDARLNALMPVDDPLAAESKPCWYDFQYGNAAFVGLNTTADDCGQVTRSDEGVPIYDTRCRYGGATYDKRQGRYVEETLRRVSADPTVDWVVVYFHGPMWTTAPNHAPREDLRASWGTFFDEHGVDLVMSGDNHVYERTHPLVGGSVREHGTTYVTNGTGGTSHYALPDPERPEVWATRTNEQFGVTQLDVNRGRVRVRYVAQDGSVHDDFALVRDGRGRTRQVERPGDPPR